MSDRITVFRFAYAVFVACFVATVSVSAQTPRLLKDIIPGSTGSGPSLYTELPGTTIFTVGGTPTVEIWKTDGTRQGTKRVAVLPADPTRVGPLSLIRVGSKAIFFRELRSGSGSSELWETDGTTTGTRRLGTVQGLAWGRFPFVAGDSVFFHGRHGSTGDDVWVTDGTIAGTRLPRDFKPPFNTTGSSVGAVIGGEVLLNGDDQPTGNELWRSDGTPAGTTLVREVLPGPNWGVSGNMFRLGRDVFFVGDTGSSRYDQLWKTDGTSAGTTLFKSFNAVGFNNGLLGAAGDHLYFYAETTRSTWDLLAVHQRTAVATTVWTGRGVPRDARPFKNGLLFLGWFTPWFSDGTAAGTKQLSTQSASFGSGDEFVATGSRFAYFPDSDGPFVTDGTPAGTRKIATNMTNPSSFTVSHGKLYFSNYDTTNGWEPWVIDLGASSVQRGTGLGVNARIPDLTATDPVLGRSTTVTIDGAVRGAGIVLGLSPTISRPFKIARHAWIYVQPPHLLLIQGQATGERWSTNLGVPNVAQLAGVPVVFQAMLLNTGAPRGYELTNAAVTHLGN